MFIRLFAHSFIQQILSEHLLHARLGDISEQNRDAACRVRNRQQMINIVNKKITYVLEEHRTKRSRERGLGEQ